MNYKNHQYSLCYIGGSPLTNKFTALAYNLNDSSVLNLNHKIDDFTLPGKVIEWTNRFKNINHQIPWELKNQGPIMFNLCSQLGLN